MIVFFFFAVSPVYAHDAPAEKNEDKTVLTTEKEQITVEDIGQIRDRVEEIRSMDRSKLSADVRMDLKRELIQYKDLLQAQDPVIYIGGGTLILLIILLAILL